MTSRIVLTGILTTSVFLICILFCNSNNSRLPQINPDGEQAGHHSLLTLNVKEIIPEIESIRQKRGVSDKSKDIIAKTKDKAKTKTKDIISRIKDKTNNKTNEIVDKTKAKIKTSTKSIQDNAYEKINKKATKISMAVVGSVIGIIVLFIVILCVIYFCIISKK